MPGDREIRVSGDQMMNSKGDAGEAWCFALRFDVIKILGAGGGKNFTMRYSVARLPPSLTRPNRGNQSRRGREGTRGAEAPEPDLLSPECERLKADGVLPSLPCLPVPLLPARPSPPFSGLPSPVSAAPRPAAPIEPTRATHPARPIPTHFDANQPWHQMYVMAAQNFDQVDLVNFLIPSVICTGMASFMGFASTRYSLLRSHSCGYSSLYVRVRVGVRVGLGLVLVTVTPRLEVHPRLNFASRDAQASYHITPHHTTLRHTTTNTSNNTSKLTSPRHATQTSQYVS